MAAFAFVLVFVLLGLGALFLGMRGGPRARPRAAGVEEPARPARRDVAVRAHGPDPGRRRARRGDRDREVAQLDPRGEREGAHRDPGAWPRAVLAALQELPHAGGREGDGAGRPEPRRAAPAQGAGARRDQERAARTATATWPPSWSRAATPRRSRSSSRSPSATRPSSPGSRSSRSFREARGALAPIPPERPQGCRAGRHERRPLSVGDVMKVPSCRAFQYCYDARPHPLPVPRPKASG